ncbi:MAG TPA: PQQ-dependent sugar dehydrogenase [Candidatus Acidoferrum sp.]|nr:PQQ-dependent sugar dehydrogenase [Candidatus Acidoferrum sp.]
MTINRFNKLLACLLFTTGASSLSTMSAVGAENAPQRAEGLHIDPVGHGPFYYDTAEGMDIRVRVLARGLNHPWSITWLPDGSALVTEKNSGTLRRIVNDVLQKDPVLGVPAGAKVSKFTGLLDVALSPDFAKQPYVYMSYNKILPGNKEAIAVARGRWDGKNIQDTQDIFVGQEGTTNGVRLLFGADGMLYVGVYVTTDNPEPNFHTSEQKGKILRLTPDGKIPADNPFVGKKDFLPEIWSYGHRTPTGLTLNKATGEIWETEMGPNGGDEVNRVQRGANYGWPLVSLGRAYSGDWQSDKFQMEGTLNPIAFWSPGISPASLAFYTGTEFPQWKGDLFIAAMQKGQIPGTGQLVRIKFNAKGEEVRQESLLTGLRQRIRDVKMGPDGRLYLLTDEDDGVVLRIEAVGH